MLNFKCMVFLLYKLFLSKIKKNTLINISRLQLSFNYIFETRICNRCILNLLIIEPSSKIHWIQQTKANIHGWIVFRPSLFFFEIIKCTSPIAISHPSQHAVLSYVHMWSCHLSSSYKSTDKHSKKHSCFTIKLTL